MFYLIRFFGKRGQFELLQAVKNRPVIKSPKTENKNGNDLDKPRFLWSVDNVLFIFYALKQSTQTFMNRMLIQGKNYINNFYT
jgi:hypothetical protein